MSNLTVAKTILEQLGGNKFIAMTGAKNFVGSETTLSFKIGRNQTQANAVWIEYLPGADLYDITFVRAGKVRGGGFEQRKIEKIEGVYFDSLTDIFTRITGLETKLF